MYFERPKSKVMCSQATPPSFIILLHLLEHLLCPLYEIVSLFQNVLRSSIFLSFFLTLK